MTESQERRMFGENTTYNRRRHGDKPLVIANEPTNKTLVLITILVVSLVVINIVSQG